MIASIAVCGSAVAYSNPHSWGDTGWKDHDKVAFNDGYGVYAGKHDANTSVYVCSYKNLPGKLVNNKCYVSKYGYELGSHDYKILLTKFGSLVWDSRLHGPYVHGVFPDRIRNNAVIGGNEGYDVFICKGQHGDHTVVGKFVRGHGCYYGLGGREFLLKVSEDKFSVLTDRLGWTR
ncbi:hypothetical protein N480_21115 [Pseudoalteromonas luteoviolacea S2607]|uniref:Uncharacterized protein n=2 Tax=Pseudoalteromonas luteoviolacea TaxID=43657 RepID=A0A162B733_9GAMM|nr:hypothetical protein N480_21115 [Pseudoalteromonas luteoviolacea S2607]KZN67529.1 hypothetical protein N478_01900 [Pseudoalteromonas luteoviolacea S4060-1]